jgi:putative lipoic acid-binding regulatory protein
MSQPPAPEPQESYLEFPAEFPLKAIGGGDGFEAWVVAIVRKYVPGLAEPPTTTRPSAGGKYLAVTVTFTATSQAQLNAIYAELGQDPRVRMLL